MQQNHSDLQQLVLLGLCLYQNARRVLGKGVFLCLALAVQPPVETVMIPSATSEVWLLVMKLAYQPSGSIFSC